MTENQQELKEQALSIPEQARVITINDAESYERAGGILVRVKALRDKIDQVFDPIISAAFKAHKEAKSQKTKVEEPLVVAEGWLKPQLARWKNEQEQKRREAEEAEREKARKVAEDAQINKAVKLEQSGNIAAAEKVINQPVRVPPVVKPSETPKIGGVSFRQNWKARIVDDSLIPRAYMVPDMVKINAHVRSMKQASNIPGVEAYSDDVVSAGKDESVY